MRLCARTHAINYIVGRSVSIPEYAHGRQVAMKGLKDKLGSEIGAAIALVALSMVALISAVALAVDVGMLVTARTEAQRVADLSALAGAGILAIDPSAEAAARTEAIDFALLNTVQGDLAVVLPGDVVVDLVESTVTVQVMRIQSRGTPVSTFFARVFGVNSVDITAVATAIAEPAGLDSGTDCLLPIMLPDRWAERGSPSNYGYPGIDDSFDPETDPQSQDFDDDGVFDTYYPPGDPLVTGYDATAIGTRIEIHEAGGGGGGMNPSWYYPWTPLNDGSQLEKTQEHGPGGARYRDRFTNCLRISFVPGDLVLTEPGAMVGPTRKGFKALYDQDPEVFWYEHANGGNGCPWRPAHTDVDGNPVVAGCDYISPRIRAMPMFDPREAPANGRKTVPFTNFGSVFVEAPPSGSKQPYTAIWLGLLTNGDASTEPVEGLKKYIHLIK